ncbi:hypothetical protein P4H71_18515 [Paenibacillus kribbensis]|nr:hypothetical protein [Paenibacillus kribbensis]MEC0236318.1 hypothetical protein [Paenibacillus kribbensis]
MNLLYKLNLKVAYRATAQTDGASIATASLGQYHSAYSVLLVHFF